MKNPITTKDLGIVHELCTYEQWAATKFHFLYELTDDQTVKNMFKQYALEHGARHDALYQYLKSNGKSGGNPNG